MHLLSLTIALLTSCGHRCTMMFMPSTLQIDITDDGPLPPGVYAFELEGYSQHAMCVVTLPQVAPGDEVCTGNLELHLSEAGDRVIGLTAWEFHPPTLLLDVRRDGAPYAEVTFTPDYDVTEPNGQGCGETYRATVEVAL